MCHRMHQTKLCVTVAADTMVELRKRRDQVSHADLVELRLDLVRDPDVAAALDGRMLPAIVTCRPAWQGGGFTGSEEERAQLLARALELGAEYVDVEWRSEVEALLKSTGGRRIVLSAHDFGGVPPDLREQLQAMRATGAEVVKIAVMAHGLADNARLLKLAVPETPTALVAMGDAGFPSRALASRLGACWTYAGDGVAPGQLPASIMHDEFAFSSIGRDTRVFGVVGRPVSHSVSPAMHNAAFRAAQIDAVYLPLAAVSLADFFTFADAFGVSGASVTAPYKVEAFEQAKECDEVSRRVGAVNTLRRVDGGWEARNTDVAGFLTPLQREMSLPGARAAVLGAGGAARAVSLALGGANAAVTICARSAQQARRVSQATGAAAGEWPPAPDSWDLLVNATPVGTFPHIHESPVPPSLLTGALVYDLVYNPATTRLLFEAQSAGCKTVGGLDMLVAQAAEQFVWWTGVRPDVDAMRTAAVTRIEALRHTANMDTKHEAHDV